MKNNLHWSVPLFIIVGIIGLLVISQVLWLGTVMVLLGLSVPIGVLWWTNRMKESAPRPRVPDPRTQPRPAQPAQQPIPPVKTERRPAEPVRPPRRPVDRGKLGVLRYTLHQAGLDSNAPVLEADEDRTITVRDILAEMIDIAETRGRSVDELAEDIVAMYPRIFENVEAAIQQYSDEEAAKNYIARKAMSDVGWQVEAG